MGYIESNLMNCENVVYRAKLHWVIFIWPITLLLLGALVISTGSDSAGIGVVFILVATAAGIGSFINYKTSEFAVTNKRVIVKSGFIRRNSLEVLLTKVEGIRVDQSILGRILGFGSITISGTGGTKDPFPKIAAPLEFRKKTQEQIAATEGLK